jgi:hypothetical protein
MCRLCVTRHQQLADLCVRSSLRTLSYMTCPQQGSMEKRGRRGGPATLKFDEARDFVLGETPRTAPDSTKADASKAGVVATPVARP